MELIEQLPLHYHQQDVYNFLKGFQVAVDEAIADVEEFLNQPSVLNATWSIDLWEKAFGIPETEDSIEERRSRVASKMRSNGASTVEMIKNVVASFENGEIGIVEFPSEYRFEIHFLSTVGIPENLDLISQIVEEIKPAHLDYDYVIIFVFHYELNGLTHADLSAYTHSEIRNGGIA